MATPAGLPIAFALTGANADERDTCLDMIAESGTELDLHHITLVCNAPLPLRRPVEAAGSR